MFRDSGIIVHCRNCKTLLDHEDGDIRTIYPIYYEQVREPFYATCMYCNAKSREEGEELFNFFYTPKEIIEVVL